MRTLVVLLLFIVAYNGIRYLPLRREKEQGLIVHITAGDSLSQLGLIKKIETLKEESDTRAIEVVCEGPALDLLVVSRSKALEQLDQFMEQGIVFAACGRSMALSQITKEDLMRPVITVSSAEEELIVKQKGGWSVVHYPTR